MHTENERIITRALGKFLFQLIIRLYSRGFVCDNTWIFTHMEIVVLIEGRVTGNRKKNHYNKWQRPWKGKLKWHLRSTAAWLTSQNMGLSSISLLLSSGISIVLSSVLCRRKVINSDRHDITVWHICFQETTCRHSANHEPNVSS